MPRDGTRKAAGRSSRLSVPRTFAAPAPASHRKRVVWRDRTRLQQRRPAAIRRHALRTLVRVAALCAGDTIAALAFDALVASIATSPLPAGPARLLESALAGVLVSPAHLVALLVLGLLLTGNYGRRVGSQSGAHLLRGTALATGLSVWGAFHTGSWAMTAVVAVLLGALLWVLVRLGRATTATFMHRVWPGPRGAASAVFLGTHSDYANLTRGSLVNAMGDYRLVGRVCTGGRPADGALGAFEDLPDLIGRHDVETIIVGGQLPDDDLEHVLDLTVTAGCELLYSARSVTIAGVRPRLVWREEEPFFELGKPVLKAHALLAKRCVDVLGASVGLIVLAPVFAAIAIAIRIDSPGSTFFEQDRAGLGGRRFRMIKFRTMRAGADAEKISLSHLNLTGDSRLFKIVEDPRVTRFGAWLRRWSLDELPQLWNVMRGEMSLVGPRPFFESDLDDYEDHHFCRLGAKPGITGLWQVNGRSSVVDFEEVVRLDREYIEQWSLLLDLRIMLKTVPAVLGRSGAW